VTYGLAARGGRRLLTVALLLAYVCAFGVVGLKLRTLTYVAFGFGVLAFVWRTVERKHIVRVLAVSVPATIVLGYFASRQPIERMDAAWAWIAFQVAASAVFATLVLLVSRSRSGFRSSITRTP
jgi:hypothetical protein